MGRPLREFLGWGATQSECHTADDGGGGLKATCLGRYTSIEVGDHISICKQLFAHAHSHRY